MNELEKDADRRARLTKWTRKEGQVLQRVRQIMESLALAKPGEWINNAEIRAKVATDSEINQIVGKPIDEDEAMRMVNWVSRGYSQIEGILEANARGQGVEEMLAAGVPSYSFSEGGMEALASIHRRFARSSQRPFAYRLRG